MVASTTGGAGCLQDLDLDDRCGGGAGCAGAVGLERLGDRLLAEEDVDVGDAGGTGRGVDGLLEAVGDGVECAAELVLRGRG